MLAYALNERITRKTEYLREQNRVLEEAIWAAIGKTRIPLTDEQRRRPATQGKALTPAERESISSEAGGVANHWREAMHDGELGSAGNALAQAGSLPRPGCVQLP